MSHFDVKQGIDNFIYRTYNLFSNLYFQFQFNIKKSLRLNLKYKDLHKGERCFILATGPSLGDLKNYQITALSKEVTFAVNSFYKVNSTQEIIPNYYVLMDDLYWNSWSNVFNEIESHYSTKAPIFITDMRCRPFINNQDKDINDIFIYAKKYPVDHIDSDLSKNIFIGF